MSPARGLRPFLLTASLGAVLAIPSIAAEGAGEPIVRRLDPGEECWGWIVSPESGRLYARSRKHRSIVEVSPETGKVLRRFPVGTVGEMPESLVVQGSRLLSLRSTYDPKGKGGEIQLLEILDLEGGTWTHRVPAGTAAEGLFPLPGIDAFVLTWAGGNKQTLCRMDVLTGKCTIVARSVNSWGAPGADSCAFSPDGRFFALSNSEGHLCVVELLQGEGAADWTARTVSSAKAPRRMRPRQPLLFGPGAATLAVGGFLLPAGELAGGTKLDGYAAAPHPTHDLAIVVDLRPIPGNRFSSVSLELRPIAGAWAPKTVPFPEDLRAEGNFLGSPGEAPKILFDVRNDRAFCTWDEYLAVIDLARAGVPLEPLLVLSAPARIEGTVGRELRFSMQVSGVKAGEAASFEKQTGPEDMSLDGDTVRWTPAEGDRGRHTVRWLARVGKREASTSLEVQVNAPSVQLPFEARRLWVSREGRLAVIASGPVGRLEKSNEDGAHLASVDLETLDLLATRSFEEPIGGVAVSGKTVWVALHDRLLALDAADLVTRGEEPLGEAPVALEALPGGRLGVVGSAGVGMEVHDSGSLKRRAGDALEVSEALQRPRGRAAIAASHWRGHAAATSLDSDRWLLGDGRVVDADGRVLCLTALPSVPLLWPWYEGDRVVAPALWARSTRSGGTMPPWEDEELLFGEPSVTTLDRERPISLSVMARPVRDDREGRQQIVACMRELRSGYRIADMSLWQDGSAKEEPSGHPRGSTLRVECIAGRAVVLDGTRIHVGRLPPGTESAPLRIVPAAAPLMLDGSRKADISVAAEGGLPPYAFEHAGPVPFTSFTPGGSVLHIDLPALWKGHAGRSSAAATYDEHEEPSSRKNMDALHRLIAGTSLPSEQSLVVLPLRLRVHDATGEIAELDFAFPVLVPRTELESALEAKCLRTRPKPPAPKKGSVAEQARALLEECKRLEEEVSNAEARILELRDTLKQ